MKKEKKLSLKLKTLLISVGALLALVAITVFNVQNLVHKQEDGAADGMQIYSQGLSASISAQFAERYRDVKAFSHNATLLLMDREAVEYVLNDYVDSYKVYDLILFIDTEGNLIATNNKDATGKPLNVEPLYKKSYSQTPWFTAAVAQRYHEEKDKDLSGTFVEDFQRDELATFAYGKDRYSTGFTTAVTNSEGTVLGVLTARANFKWVEKEFVSLYKSLRKRGYHSAELTLLDKEGHVIVDYDPSKHGGKLEVLHDPEVLGKFNLASLGLKAAQDLIKHKSGHNMGMHKRKKVHQLTGYTTLTEAPTFLTELGWGAMARVNTKEVLAGLYGHIRFFYLAIALTFLLSSAGMFWWTSRNANGLVRSTEQLRDTEHRSATTAGQLQDSSSELSQVCNQQAAAVQETVSAMEEMMSMTSQSSEYVRQSLDSARKVSTRTEEGSQIMRSTVEAMESIQQANGQLQNMANIINEISTKTNVINDIVFKTQLLSFNASIEAARAGQHGKGFAVVAEEVGNLAQMSGAAAKEIKNLLDDSQKQVSQIVDITQGRVSEGQEVTKKALETFNDIAGEIKSISDQIGNISDATKEQESGIRQTSESMNNIDESTQRSQTVAENVSQAAQELNGQGSEMRLVMEDIQQIVLGHTENGNAIRSKPNDPPANDGKRGKILNLAQKLSKKTEAPKEPKAKATDSNVSADDDSFKELLG